MHQQEELAGGWGGLKRCPQDSVSPRLSAVLSFLCFIQKQPFSELQNQQLWARRVLSTEAPKERQYLSLRAQLCPAAVPSPAPSGTASVLCPAASGAHPAGRSQTATQDCTAWMRGNLQGKQGQVCMPEASSGLR